MHIIISAQIREPDSKALFEIETLTHLTDAAFLFQFSRKLNGWRSIEGVFFNFTQTTKDIFFFQSSAYISNFVS